MNVCGLCIWDHIKKEKFCLPIQQAPNAKPLLCTLILDTEGVRKFTSFQQIWSVRLCIIICSTKKKKDNYNQLISILCRLGIMWTCGNWGKIYRRAAGRVCLLFLQQFCASWGKLEEAALCSPGAEISNTSAVLAGQTKPHPAWYSACNAKKKSMLFREDMQAAALSVVLFSGTLTLLQHQKLFY